MLRYFLCLIAGGCFAAVTLLPMPGRAEGDLATLIDALGIGRTIEIMRAEGLRYGNEVAEEMLPSVDQSAWQVTLDRIYDTEKMNILIASGFEKELEDADLPPLIEFFQSRLGTEIVDNELSAREAFLDPETEAAAKAVYEEVKVSGDPIIGQINALIEDSDLIELNVMGALNSNLMFYRGLVDGGAFAMSEDEILTDVWSQEEEIRTDTENWMSSFLLMAYQPLEEVELDAYIALYRSSEGRALNRAMFAAFDQMYDEISYLLGQAVAQNMKTEEL